MRLPGTNFLRGKIKNLLKGRLATRAKRLTERANPRQLA